MIKTVAELKARCQRVLEIAEEDLRKSNRSDRQFDSGRVYTAKYLLTQVEELIHFQETGSVSVQPQEKTSMTAETMLAIQAFEAVCKREKSLETAKKVLAERVKQVPDEDMAEYIRRTEAIQQAYGS